MTTKEGERLAIVEERTRNIEKKLDALIESFEKFTDNSEKKFLTRIEAKVAGTLISLTFGAISLWLALKDHIKH